MKRWAFSVLALRDGDATRRGNVINQAVTTHMSCAVVEATSEDEARGKAIRIASKIYPQSDGYRHHQVAISSADNVVTYENVGMVG